MNQSEKQVFLGRGLSFPPSFDKLNRDIQMAEAHEDIQQSLQIILATHPGERTLELDFGCNLSVLAFEQLDLSLASALKNTVKTAILLHEPRIDVNEVRIEQDQNRKGRVLIEVDYTVRTTNTRFNFVYPFYLEEGTDIEK